MSDKRTHWSPEKRAAVVTAYIALGNSALTSAVTKVPEGTIRAWKREDWWKELEGILREEEHSTLDSKLRKVVEKSIDLVMDRLENGDFVFDQKTGEVVRKPVSLKDAHKVGSESIDRREVLRRFSSKAVEKPSLENYVKQLAEQFTQFTQTLKGKEVQVIEVIQIEETDAKETGLQTGIRSLPRSAGPNQEPLGTEPSPQGDGKENR